MNEKLPISTENPIKARYYDYPYFTYPWHFHSQYEIIYVKKGFGQCFVGDSIEKFSEGFIILLGANLPHYMKSDEAFKTNNKKLRVKGTIIQFEKDFMYYSFTNYPQFIQIKALLEMSKRGIYFPVSSSKKLTYLLNKIPAMGSLNQLTSLLLLLQEMVLCEEKRLLATPHFHDSLPDFGNKRLEKVLSFINSNYTRNLQLKDVATIAAMNHMAFCRYFKEATGKTLLQYIAEMRIGYACKLLTLNDMTINQICIECGFESITQFNRTFKRATQLTPTEYRKHIL